MGKWDENWSSGWTSTSTKIANMAAAIIAGNTITIKISPMGWWRSKWYSFFVNGVFQGNEFCPIYGDWVVSYPLDTGTEVASFHIVESGGWSGYETGRAIPDGWVEEEEALSAARLRFQWTSEPTIKGPYGTTQLTSFTVSGCQRGVNLDPINNYPQRGRLYITINTSGTTHYVKFWSGGEVQCSGSIIGDGLVTCTEENGSGLNIQCLLTYTEDIVSGAWLDVVFPEEFQIHYSTDALTYPRTPETVVYDDGYSNTFSYLSPVLSGSLYNYNVLAVSDQGVVTASTSPPTDSPKTLYQGPIAPTITGATGTASACTINWTEGEAGCWYTIYYSNVCEPVNLGEWVSPVSFSTATGATSTTLPPINVSGYPIDRSTYLTTLSTAIGTEVTNLNTVYDAGQTGFLTQLTTFKDNIKAALDTFGDDIFWNVDELLSTMDQIYGQLYGFVDSLGTSYSDAEWQALVGPILGETYYRLGLMYENVGSRWTLSDGTIYPVDTRYSFSIKDIVNPVSLNAKIYVIIRATKQSTGVQEHNDNIYEIEFDSSGDVVLARPNNVSISETSSSGLTISAITLYSSENEKATPTHIDFYVTAAANTIDYDTPTTSVAIGSDYYNLKKTTATATVIADGYYKIAAKARVSSTGARSESAIEQIILVDSTAPDGVTDLSAQVIRGDDLSRV